MSSEELVRKAEELVVIRWAQLFEREAERGGANEAGLERASQLMRQHLRELRTTQAPLELVLESR